MNIGQWVHFSVDDVIKCFKWIYETKPESIFDEVFLAKLKEWHDRYGIQFDLYIFERCEGFSIELLQEKYWRELEKQKHWLKLAWHGIDDFTNMGEIQSIDEEKVLLDSIDRTYRLIPETQRTQIARLHMWAGTEKILEHLNSYGINAFCTSDKGIQSYNLSEQEMKNIELYGGVYRKTIIYQSTDVRLDEFGDNILVEDLLKKIKRIQWKFPQKRLEIFFHEWIFEEIISKIDMFLEKFLDNPYPLQINVGTVFENNFYFTTYNTQNLYKLDLIKNEINIVCILPCETYGRNFSNMIIRNGKIWLIPWDYEKIIIFDLVTKQFQSFDIPFLQEQKGKTKFRKAIEDENFLWLLPAKTKALIKIDMDKLVVYIYNNWPDEIYYDADCDMNFFMSFSLGNNIYLVKKGASHNLLVNKTTGKVSVLNYKLGYGYGMLINDNKYILAPYHKDDAIEICDINKNLVERICVPDDVWGDAEYFEFWYLKKIDNIIYLLPHEAKKILLLNLDDFSMEIIEIPSKEASTKWRNKVIGIYDVFRLSDKDYFIPYAANRIFVRDLFSNEMTYIDLAVHLNEINKEEFKLGLDLDESENYSLQNFLDNINDEAKHSEWTEIVNI